MQELELYKLITESEYVEEMGWINEKEFCIWVSFMWIDELIEAMKKIFGNSLLDEGGIDVHMLSDCVCIDLCDLLGCYLQIEDIFPKDKYQH